MKTKLLPSIMLSILLISLASAFELPFTVGGQVHAQQGDTCGPLANSRVDIVNKGSGDTYSDVTAEDGSFAVNINDPSKFPQEVIFSKGRQQGDTIRIQVCSFQESPDPACFRDFALVNANPISPQIFDFCTNPPPDDTKFVVGGKEITWKEIKIGASALAVIIALVAGYKWGPGFIAFMRKKSKPTQEKTAKTVASRKKAGKYG